MSKDKRDYILFLEDILDALEKIENYTKNLSFTEFAGNGILFLNLQLETYLFIL